MNALFELSPSHISSLATLINVSDICVIAILLLVTCVPLAGDNKQTSARNGTESATDCQKMTKCTIEEIV